MEKLLASGLGIGYIRKGGGTVASIACCLGLYLILPQGGTLPVPLTLLMTGGLLVLGTIVSTRVERHWGKDNYRVVIDEIAGMWISMIFLPITVSSLLIGLVLFRVFDIYKPFFIRKMENLPGGSGVMMDDVLAGIYTNLLLQVIINFRLL
jgi:phosphatidylglycerophosphatase A